MAEQAASKKVKRRKDVELRTPDHTVSLEVTPEWPAIARDWNYIVQTRNRWRSTAAQALYERCQKVLLEFGASTRDLAKLAIADTIEVSVLYDDESTNWAARTMPWEFLLSGAVHRLRRRESSFVVRHLDCLASSARHEPQPTDEPTPVLIVCSTPGKIGELYDTTSERLLPELKLRVTGHTKPTGKEPTSAVTQYVFEHLENPTLADLKKQLRVIKPRVLHYCGVDTHQGAELLGEPNDTHRLDGIMLSDRHGEPQAVIVDHLVKAIEQHPPQLVVYNTYHSAGRIAARSVAAGAEAALGFQDLIDDRLAEMFLSDFYRIYAMSGGDSHTAFLAALQLLRDYPGERRGSGIVLWNAYSLYDRPRGRKTEAWQQATVLAGELRARRKLSRKLDDAEDVRELIAVRLQPTDRLNYALLHNHQSLFKNFHMVKKCDEQLDDVQVRVSLQIGAEHPTYEAALTVTDDITDWTDRVRVPLSWLRDGGLWDDVRSSLSVHVTWRDRVLYSESSVVTIPPANEWEDTDENRQWLPSFVYPRDPLISRVVRRGLRYLVGATGNGHAAFDGYQQVSDSKTPPKSDWEIVDRQVRAIWSALTYDFRFAYSNPPPSYSDATQRLRTPSEIAKDRYGTCIDLALLLAACLEHVEIYPVIFLLNGHAFPGYWRSPQAYDNFVQVTDATAVPSGQQTVQVVQSVPWLLAGQNGHTEVVRRVRRGELVPLEAVWMTEDKDFEESVDEGLLNLRNPDEFHSLLDVMLARSAGVTPLPIRGLQL